MKAGSFRLIASDFENKGIAMKIIILTSIYMLIVFTSNAEAYLDPGTGSYVLQLVIAGIVSCFFAIKLSWRKIVEFFSNIFKGK